MHAEAVTTVDLDHQNTDSFRSLCSASYTDLGQVQEARLRHLTRKMLQGSSGEWQEVCDLNVMASQSHCM